MNVEGVVSQRVTSHGVAGATEGYALVGSTRAGQSFSKDRFRFG